MCRKRARAGPIFVSNKKVDMFSGKSDIVIEDVALRERNGVPHELVFFKTAAGSSFGFGYLAT